MYLHITPVLYLYLHIIPVLYLYYTCPYILYLYYTCFTLRDNHAINRFYLEFTHILTSYLLVTVSSN